MPLSTLMFLYCCSASFTDTEDCGGAAGAWARAATIAVAIEIVDTTETEMIFFPAHGIRNCGIRPRGALACGIRCGVRTCGIGTRAPMKFWRQECSRTRPDNCYPEVISPSKTGRSPLQPGNVSERWKAGRRGRRLNVKRLAWSTFSAPVGRTSDARLLTSTN